MRTFTGLIIEGFPSGPDGFVLVRFLLATWGACTDRQAPTSQILPPGSGFAKLQLADIRDLFWIGPTVASEARTVNGLGYCGRHEGSRLGIVPLKSRQRAGITLFPPYKSLYHRGRGLDLPETDRESHSDQQNTAKEAKVDGQSQY